MSNFLSTLQLPFMYLQSIIGSDQQQPVASFELGLLMWKNDLVIAEYDNQVNLFFILRWTTFLRAPSYINTV